MPWYGPFDREKRFMESLDLRLIQKALWPLLILFVLLSFSDTLTTLLAAASGQGFVEFNPIASRFFQLGFAGFMLAYLLKFVPVVPLFYMVWCRREDPKDDFQIRLLKFTAFVVLVAADIGLGAIVIGNNLPLLLGHAFS
ncbi:MAG: hypothetical protein JRN59_00180 [Nitrososphaerota archaeon]|nr:hypothetical protein [Nitrososphaerota archaeon]MDG6919929.1 hypothetical protein [Nitrososphaerota archaeon]